MSETELRGCPSCKGRKLLTGLGGIPESCYKCKGVGWIEVPVAPDVDDFLAATDSSAHEARRLGSGNAIASETYDIIEPPQQSVEEDLKLVHPPLDKTDLYGEPIVVDSPKKKYGRLKKVEA